LSREASLLVGQPAGFCGWLSLKDVMTCPSKTDFGLRPAGSDSDHHDAGLLVRLVEGCVVDFDVPLFRELKLRNENILFLQLSVRQILDARHELFQPIVVFGHVVRFLSRFCTFCLAF
jgi:hypothetical protein